MSTLKALRSRIRTVHATQKITTAMKLVSAAKLRKAQEQLEAFRDYAQALNDLWISASEDIDAQDFPKWLRASGEDKLYIVIMADRGLCGSYNAAMVRHMKKVIESERGQPGKTKILPVGLKAVDLLKADFEEYFQEILFPNREKKPRTAEVIDTLSHYLVDLLKSNSYGSVKVFYTKFINVLRQDIESIELLGGQNEGQAKPSKGYPPLFEPNQETMIERLAPLYFKNQIRYVVYEAATAEQAARMRAMDTATENAKEVIRSLKRTYNRTRQAGITRELIEIISGANALKA